MSTSRPSGRTGPSSPSPPPTPSSPPSHWYALLPSPPCLFGGRQARSLPTDKLRPAYIAVNAIIYVVQLCIWIYLGINDNAAVELASKIFIVAVSFVALLGFSVYGGRLFVLLRRFPIESKGRQKKLYEVGTVTAICVTCFLIRCVVVALSAFDADVSLEVLDHPVLDFFYYMFAEILPSALVLFVLRKLPPKRVSAQYHPIN
ncbi:La-related protein 6C [Zea mays]|uniref:La-related protein 6C n=1 Tax=Zea mays TaxID=4577 RepID=A0A1D6HQN9_MAIZE|nr:La-related protein 6C [Zea mays]